MRGKIPYNRTLAPRRGVLRRRCRGRLQPFVQPVYGPDGQPILEHFSGDCELFTTFKVQLERGTGPYHTSDVLNGYAIINCQTYTNIRGIQLRVVGEELLSNQPLESNHGNLFKHTFLRYIVQLMGDPERSQVVRTLKGGEHKYAFSFQLPDGLPDSFTGSHSLIQYYVKLSLLDEHDFIHRCNRFFLFASNAMVPYNMRQAMSPVFCERVKTVRSWLGQKGHITVRAMVNRTVFKPGDFLTFNARIDNDSGLTLNKMRMSFVREIRYTHGNRTVNEEMARLYIVNRDQEVKAHQTDNWDNERFMIPDFRPFYLGGALSLKLSYYIMMEVEINGFRRKPIVITLPIEIGDVDTPEAAKKPYVFEKVRIKNKALVPTA